MCKCELFIPDKYVGMLAAIRRHINEQAAEVWMQSLEVWIERKDDPVSTDGLHYVVIHRHCNVHVTVLSAVKQLA